jgi:protease-4
MQKNIFWILMVLAIAVSSGFVYLVQQEPEESASMSNLPFGSSYRGKQGLGVIELKDVIFDTEWQVDIVRDWADDEYIRGLIVDIDSPGGAVAPSQELYDAILHFRQKKPVYAVMRSLAASGGYYVASAANKIYASRGTLTGSIGVIMQTIDFSQLSSKMGVTANTIATGPYKDTGAGFRAMRDDEKQYLQNVVDETYEQFLQDIQRGRSKPAPAKLRSLADGRIYTGAQALEDGLIDSLGGFSQATTELAQLVALKKPDDPFLIYPDRDWQRLEKMLERFEIEGSVALQILEVLRGPIGPGSRGAYVHVQSANPVWAIWPGAMQVKNPEFANGVLQ